MPITLDYGEDLWFDVAVEYQGPVYREARIRTSIGVRSWPLGIFEEVTWKEHAFEIGENVPSWSPFSKRVPMTIPNTLKRGETYDIEVKLRNAPGGVNIVKLDRAITIVEVAPAAEFRNLTADIGKN